MPGVFGAIAIEPEVRARLKVEVSTVLPDCKWASVGDSLIGGRYR